MIASLWLRSQGQLVTQHLWSKRTAAVISVSMIASGMAC
jgi:hypothetical protein